MLFRYRPVLLLLTATSFPVVLGSSPTVIGHHRQAQDAAGNATNNCSLCKGLALVDDDIPFPENNLTCAMWNTYFENGNPGNGGIAGSIGLDTNNTFVPGTCRAESLFNSMFDACCERSVPTYECEQNIHERLFGSESKYNSVVPPIIGRKQPLNVSVFFQFEALQHMDVEQGVLTMVLSISMRWVDPRLAWEIEDSDTCANMITAWTGNEVEKTSIWLPDLDLMNEVDGMTSIPETRASIFSDGTVEWFMTGGVTAFCAFTGLAQIPFDTLGCQFLFGRKSRQHSPMINYVLETPGYYFDGIFDSTYNEFKPVPELGEMGYTIDGMIIYLNVFFKRATNHYVQNIVVPTIILTYLSFFTFLLDLRIGERLGFGMALALVVVAQQIVTSDMTPISDHPLWLDKFVAYSFYWVLVGVVQSVLIGFLYYLREDRKEKHEARRLASLSEEHQPILPILDSMDNMDDSKESSSTDGEVEQLATKTTSDIVQVPKRECKRLSSVTQDDCVVKAISKHWVYTFPLRKMDFICLVGTTVSYTAFVVIMFSTGWSNTWLSNEPRWFDEDTTDAFVGRPYNATDPNS